MSALRVGVFGAGSWGTALAAQAARNGHATLLWGRDGEQVAAMREARRNLRYLPDLDLPEGLGFTDDLAEAAADADLLLVVVPSHAFPQILRELAPLRRADTGLAWATKGFELGSGRFLHEVAEEFIGADAAKAVVTGPSFAREVTAGLPTAVTVHSEDAAFAQRVAEALHGPTFRVYTGGDMLGAELGGAMKNVLAVATGIADGMELGLNARAGLITRGLNEMLRLNQALGGRAETLMGLAGLGDLVLTCTGDLSRNRRLGLALGRGQGIQEAVKAIGQVVEAIQTADEVMRLATRHDLDLPICALVARVLHGDLTPREGLQMLLSREQKPEYPKGLFGD
ncbi:NAD(P)H-dependent glycerol-3-phosphate dehydrogenase [Pseudomarimonas salicorniae]|uniref:Glycerol-3-phosphate dehydrogenase [NAD(P)+] n=1 Tax=Pseudomarimonas salicorniae TaxID=2933270 RepID=A0ABT0GER8_9GAMM|nr:NAD(P)H-dependent glycerol-3-phosphate dehydrogenase [Lysobacter sp. CAU 1642]MCK7592515.1 NAD(P)-dependent glycerol-3-phosphate dehydrogenase [Lysobacter sp. CAU 1642]